MNSLNLFTRTITPYWLFCIARDSIYYFVVTFFFLYLKDILFLPLSVAVSIVLLIKILDMVKEPFLALFMDYIASKYKTDKFKLFMVTGGIFNGVLTYALFNQSELFHSDIASVLSAITFIFWIVSFSLLDLSSWSVIASFGIKGSTRENLSAVSRISSLIGFCFSLYLLSNQFSTKTPIAGITKKIGHEVYNEFGLYLGIFVIVASIICALVFKAPGQTHKKEIKYSQTLKNFFANEELMITFGITLLQQVAISVFITSFTYFILTLPAIPSDQEIFYKVHLPWVLTALFSCLLFSTFVKLTSRKFVFIVAMLLPVISYFVMFVMNVLGTLNINLIGLLVSIATLGYTLSVNSTSVMTADCVDYGEFKFGSRTEFMFFSVQTIGAKFAYFFVMLITGLSFSYTDIVLQNQTLNVQEFSIYLCFMIVTVCSFAMIGLYVPFYKLHGSFFENILNAIKRFTNGKVVSKKAKFNAVRYALDEHCVIHNLKAKDFDEVLKILTARLKEVNAISSRHEFIEGIYEKIAQNPAGIAHGIAIPHTRGDYVKRSAIAVATLNTPMNCGSIDNKPCDLFFLIAVPDDGVSHINLLSNLSLMLSEPGFADKLRKAGSSVEITKRLISCEKNLFS